MDLITGELSKLQSKCDSFEQKCHSMVTELNLMNKLLSFEHKFSQHLFDLLLKYDYYVNASAKLVTNGRQTSGSIASTNARQMSELKTLNQTKDLAVGNLLQVKQLRQELHDWRVANDRLPDPEGTDHNYSHKKSKSTIKVSVPPVITLDITAGSADDLMPPPAPALAVQLEVIPKDEPVSDGDEDTDTASERGSNSAVTAAVPEVVIVNDVSGGDDGVVDGEASTSQPFTFVSQYLSQNLHFRKTYGHLLDNATAAGTSGQQNDADIDVKPIVRPVHLDINRNSDSDDTDVMGNSIFADEMIDLTPKKAPPQRKIKLVKKGHKKKRSLNASRRKSVAKSPAKSTVNENPVITKTPEKVAKKALELPKTRSEKRLFNETYIKSNKKLVLKGKTYYCKWSKCTYSSDMRGNAIRHMMRHSGETPYQCKLCPQGFRDKRNLANHMMKHNVLAIKTSAAKRKARRGGHKERGTGDIICPECQNRYQDYGALMKHVKGKHGQEKYDRYRQQYLKLSAAEDIPTLPAVSLLCPECNKGFMNSTLLARHVRRLHGKPMAKQSKKSIDSTADAIPVDPETKTLNSKLNSFAKTIVSANKSSPKLSAIKTPKVVKKGVKKVVRRLSLTPNTSNSSLNISQLSHSSTEKEWKCDYNFCQRSYNSKHNLKRHQKEIHKRLSKVLFFQLKKEKHSDIKYFIPKDATRTGSTNAKIIAEDNIVDINSKPQASGQSPAHKSFVCNVKNCSNSYQTISGLYKHKKVKHNSSKPFKSVAKMVIKHVTGELSHKIITIKKNKPTIKFKGIKPLVTPSAMGVDGVDDINADINEKIQYECTYTDCSFKGGHKAVVSHFAGHFPGDDKPFKCVITDCQYSAKVLCKLKVHVLNRHSEQQFIKAMDATGVRYPSWY